MSFKPILANFDLSGLPEVLEAANKRTAQNEQRSYRRTVENWENKPEFYIEVSGSSYGGLKDYKVYTDSLIYLWVDKGTDWHTIKPNGDYPLRIKGGKEYGYPPYNKIAYDPKTDRNGKKIVSNGSGEYLDDDGFFEQVRQRIEPRNFTINILSKAPKRWESAIKTEIDKYIKANVK